MVEDFNNDKELERLLAMRYVPEISANLAERIIAQSRGVEQVAYSRSKQKRENVPLGAKVIDFIKGAISISTPAMACLVIFMIGAYIGLNAAQREMSINSGSDDLVSYIQMEDQLSLGDVL